MMLQTALKEQFHAGLAMLAECVELCPDDVWLGGQVGREGWRIAFHAAFFTQFGLGQGEGSYSPWPGRPVDKHEEMWQKPEWVEPYELPEDAEPFTQAEGTAYIAFVDGMVDSAIEGLDLESEESGFSNYTNMSKLSNLMMNLRHLQGHVGQLSELLLARGIETSWVGKGTMGEWKRWEEEN